MRITPEKNPILFSAARIVRSGGVVIVPTETFYALAADPFQEHAVRRIFEIKSRPETIPLPLISARRAVVDKMIPSVCHTAEELMNLFWPGSLTILLEPTFQFSRLVIGPTGKVGVRVPPDCPAKQLAELAGGWITATSANRSGEPSPDRVTRISAPVLDAVDLVVDSGRSPGGKPSTVVEPLADGLRFVREGAISRKVIRAKMRVLVSDKSS